MMQSTLATSLVARADTIELAWRHRVALALQRCAGIVASVVYIPLLVLLLRAVMNYRIQNVANVRRRARQLIESAGGPLLICPNHLTMIDSAIVAWGLAPWWRYLTTPRLLPWNLPERTNFSNPFVRVFCYVARCIPIERGGSRRKQQIALMKCARVLRSGDLALVFPEGRRSRSGSVDPETRADGVGRLVKALPGCRVLCVYLRGERQDRYSTIPRRGERFYMDVALITPQTAEAGLRGSREIVTGILAQLQRMEDDYRARGQ